MNTSERNPDSIVWLRGNWKVTAICALIAFALAFVAFSISWFGLKATYHADNGDRVGVLDLDFALTEYTYHWTWQGNLTEDLRVQYSDLADNQNWSVLEVFSITQTLTILPLVLILIVLGSTLLVARGKLDKRIGVVAGVLAVASAIASPAYFAFAYPTAMEQDAVQLGSPPTSGFWGSDTVDYLGYDGTVSWGPGLAWYLMSIASFFMTLGTLTLMGVGSPSSRGEPPGKEGLDDRSED